MEEEIKQLILNSGAYVDGINKLSQSIQSWHTTKQEELIEHLFKELVREEGSRSLKQYPIEEWESISLKAIVDVLSQLKEGKEEVGG